MENQLEAYKETVLGLDFFYLVLENIPTKVFVKDMEGRVIYANKAYYDFFPKDRQDEIIGMVVHDHLEPEARESSKATELLASALPYAESIFDVKDFNGINHTFRIKKKYFDGPRGQRLMLNIASDITQMAQREHALEESNSQLGQFAAVAAHDLRSPLSTYGGLLYLIQNDPETTLSPTAQDYLERMMASTEQLKNNISCLLNTFKAEHNHQINRRPVDLETIFDEVCFNLEDAINRNKATVAAGPLPTLEVDAELIRHLFHNLIENSIKYKGSEPPSITLTYRRDPLEHLFCLEDNGLGIPKDKAGDVFSAFNQGGRSATGIGLGLSLCQKVIDLHQGRIWIDDTYQKGCRICFTLPV